MSERSLTASTSVATLLAIIVVVSALSPLAASLAAGQSSGMVTVPGEQVGVSSERVDPNAPPQSELGAGGTGPPPNAGPPPAVVDRIPSHALDNIRASEGAASLTVEAAPTTDGGLALVLTDDQNSDGRRVSIPVTVFEKSINRVPGVVYGTHESGETWQSQTTVEDGYVTFRVPHFSTNTVTFSGEVTILGAFGDGSSVGYGVTSVDAVDNFSINVTGSDATETDTESGTAADGESVSLSVAGNAPPSDATVTVTRNADASQSENPVSNYGDGTAGSSWLWIGDDSDGAWSSEHRIKPPISGNISNATVNVASVSGSDYGATLDIYIVQEKPDGTVAEGALVKSGYDPTWSTGPQTIEFDNEYTVQSGSNYTIEYVISGANSDGDTDQLEVAVDTSQSGTWYGRSRTDGFSSTGSDTADVTYGMHPSATSVSVAGDSSASFGQVDPGESTTKTVPISLSTSGLDVSFDESGTVDVTAEYTETTETVDPSISVNGHETSYSGTLADGSTVSLDANSSWVESSNTVNVSVGDGTLSADAPTPTTDLNYRHGAQDKQSVNYSANKWTERYNVSRTYADATENANLTIPHDGNVVAIDRVEKSVNDGTWQSVDSSNYNLDGTTLTVQLGDLASGDKVEMRTTGRRVAVAGGSITVLDPTTTGERLDTKIRLDSWADGDHIGLGGTPDGRRVHYTYNDPGGEYVRIESSGVQQLYIPNGADGSEMRVSTIPVQVDVKSGAARFEVPDPSTTQPEFRVKPGSTEGDTVEYTFVDAADGTKYSLYSVSQGVVRDSGTANSPLTLEDDDSDETLMFKQEDDSGSSSGDASLMGPIQQPTGDGPLNSVPVILLAYVGALIALYIVDQGGTLAVPNPIPSMVPLVGGRRVRVPLPGSQGPLFWGGTAASTLIVLEFLSNGLISRTIFRTVEDLTSPLSSVVPLAGIVGVGLLGYYLYRRFIVGQNQSRDIVIRSDGGDEP